MKIKKTNRTPQNLRTIWRYPDYQIWDSARRRAPKTWELTGYLMDILGAESIQAQNRKSQDDIMVKLYNNAHIEKVKPASTYEDTA